MSNDKLCEYLTDMGILLFDNIELFFKINSIKNDNNAKNEPEKLKNSLFQYLQKTSKDENLLRTMSKQIIDSYYNNQAVTKYKSLKTLINIYQNKLYLIYNNFFINISLYIINKNKSNKNDKDKTNRTYSDDNYFLRNSQEDLTIRKKTKTKSKPKKRIPVKKRTNQYRNNYYMNIQDSNSHPHSFFVNTNNNDNFITVYKNDYQNPNIKNVYMSNDNYGRDIYNDNIISYKYYSPMYNIRSKTPIKTINNNIPMKDYNIDDQMFKHVNNSINMNNIGYNQEMEDMNNNNTWGQLYNNNNINNNNIDMYFDTEDDYDFLDNQKKHLQKVHNKIMNLKNEKISKIEEQCTFTPQIHINRKYLKNENNNNVFDKLYNESTKFIKKNQERIKKTIEAYKFAPSIEGNDKYKVKLPFEKRLEKSIKKKDDYINEQLKLQKKKMEDELVNKNVKVDVKTVLNRIYYKPMEDIKKEREKSKGRKEKPVINWKKRFNDYNVKYSRENDYKKQLEKRKKLLNNISINNNNGNSGNIISFNEFIKEKDKEKEKSNGNNNNENVNNIINNNNDEDAKNNNNIGIDNNINEENQKENTPESVQEAINEAYRSTSIKQILNDNNGLFSLDK